MTSPDDDTYAGPLRRIAAYMIDLYWLLPRLIGAMVVMSPLTLLSKGDPNSPAATAIGGLLVLGLFAVVALSMARWESSRWSASPGKLFMGVKLTDTAGAPISFVRSLCRNAASVFLWPFFVTIVITQRRQALHDLMTRTLLPRLGAAAEERRRAFLVYWSGETPKVMVPVILGIVTIPVIAGIFLLITWLPRWWAYRKEARRLLFAIAEPPAARV